MMDVTSIRSSVRTRASQAGAANTTCSVPKVSQRVLVTDPPVIVKTKQLMARAPPSKQVMSLAQGIVHWQPPPAAMAAAAQLLGSADGSSINGYGPAEGLPALRTALQQKLAERNGLQGYEVMVTAGANQAFVNIVLSLVDEGDRVVLFTPYYFNHIMALQMTGGADKVLLGPCDPDSLHPDLAWLQQQLQGPHPPKMVVLVNPCNPTGVLLQQSEAVDAAAMCAAAGSWLVLDNTYEDFVYGGRSHHCMSGPNILNVFSFSKAYGMMGWRVGYIAYPGQELLAQFGGVQDLGAELLKVQDTVAVCASQLSQHIALAALQHGGEYLQQQLTGLLENQAYIEDALSPLGTAGHGWVGGEGAIYYWAKLPTAPKQQQYSAGESPAGEDGAAAVDSAGEANGKSPKDSSSTGLSGSDTAAARALAEGDEAVVEWLIQEHGVCIIPGSACGAPGYVRVAFANLKPEQCKVAAGRLKEGLHQLVRVAAGVEEGVEEFVSAAAC